MALENKHDLAQHDLALYKAKKLDADLKLNLSAQDLFRLYCILDKKIREKRSSILTETISYDDFINQAIETKEAEESAISAASFNQFLGKK